MILGALGGVALAQRPAPEPTALELFAAKPDARVLFSKHVGSIVSSDGKVMITALIVENAQDPRKQMRGVRFDLQSNSAMDQVYLDETQLTSTKREVRLIEWGIEKNVIDDSVPYRVTGTESCWMPEPRVRILCPDYYVGPDWSGLRLRALGGPGFEFPDHKPSELVHLIDLAIAELKQD